MREAESDLPFEKLPLGSHRGRVGGIRLEAEGPSTGRGAGPWAGEEEYEQRSGDGKAGDTGEN